MIVEFTGGIEAAHGTLYKGKNGTRVIITTRKAPSTNPNKVRMYLRSAKAYKRKKPASDAEIAARQLFTKRQAYVRQLLDAAKAENKRLSLAKAWKVAKQEIN